MAKVRDPKFYVLTDEQLRVFGSIVHLFAQFEYIVGVIIHEMAGGKMYALTAMIVSGLGYSAKVDTLRSLLEVIDLDGDKMNSIAMKAVIDAFAKHNSLRNAIAHNTWTNGDRDGSIKPIFISVRGGKPKIKGVRTEEQDYRIDELLAIEESLKGLFKGLGDLGVKHFHKPPSK